MMKASDFIHLQPVVKGRNGKLVACIEVHQQIDSQERFRRWGTTTVIGTKYDSPDGKARSDWLVYLRSIKGSCSITINLDQLDVLCRRAARNKSRRATDGPVEVKFTGTVLEVLEEVPGA